MKKKESTRLALMAGVAIASILIMRKKSAPATKRKSGLIVNDPKKGEYVMDREWQLQDLHDAIKNKRTSQFVKIR